MSRITWMGMILVAGVVLAFALRSLLLIDATGLWSDELYSVGKSFQPSPLALLSMLREDTHPPAYYGLLWAWGQLIGQSPISLRLLSWLAYCLGGVVILVQTAALAVEMGVMRHLAVPVAALLVFCSPYPIRFSLEGKSYALLVVLVALAWCWRRGGRLLPYGLCVALAALTHFYGLFLFLSAAVWDLSRRRWSAAVTAALAVIPALCWIGYAAAYLFSSRSGSWIGPPDFALLEETLARSLGLWPLPKLALLLLSFWGLRRWGGLRRHGSGNWHERRLLDRSGLLPSLLMVLAVVLISFVKPLAFSRYFVVLLPALVPWCAVQIASFSWSGSARWFGSALLVVMLLSWWGAGFAELDPSGNGVREQDQFAAVSRLTGGERDRFTPRPRLFNLSDQMELAMGRIPDQPTSWQDTDDLENRLLQQPALNQLWLASSGPPALNQRRLEPSRRLLEQNRFQCEPVSERFTHALVLHCRSSATPRPD